MLVRSSVGATPFGWIHACKVTLNNTIIRNLGGVAKAIDQFEKAIATFNASLVATLQVMKNNMYFANWMGLVMLAASRTQIERRKKCIPIVLTIWRLRMVSWFQVHTCRRTAGCRWKDEAWRLLLLPKRSSFVSRVSLYLPLNLQDGYLPSRYHTVHTDQCDMEHDLQSPSQAIRIFQGRKPPFLTAKPQGRGVEINSILPGLERVRASRTHHSDSTVCIGF